MITDTGSSPLTVNQRDLWLCCKENEVAQNTYNETLLIGFSGKYDLKRIKEAIEQVYQRHNSWQMSFTMQKQQLYQLRKPPHEFIINEIQLYPLISTPENQIIKLLALIDEASNLTFNLVSDQLMRCFIYILSQNFCVIQICLPHLVIDGRSNNILIEEFLQFYNQELVLPEPQQYEDYIYLEHARYLENSAHQVYWKNKLKNFEPLQLIPDIVANPIDIYKGQHYQFQIPLELTNKIDVYCKKNKVTLVSFLMLIFSKTMSAYIKQRKFYFGVPFSNRVTREDNTCVGLCSNIYPMCIDILDSMDTKSELKNLQRTLFSTIDNRFVDFQKMTPIPGYSILFNYDDPCNEIYLDDCSVQVIGLSAPYEKLNLSILKQSEVYISSGHAQFDFTFNITKLHGQYYAVIEYAVDKFSQKLISELAKQYTKCLGKILS